MSTSTVTYAKNENLVTRCIAGETIIVPVRGRVGDLDSIYTLNETGSRVWELLDGHRGPDAIAEALAWEFDVKEEEASQDVEELLGSLEEAGLIHATPGE